jgi:hypothetical protein
MPPHDCVKENKWGEFDEFKARALAHILEGEKDGGHRDRLAKVEAQMKILMGAGKWFVIAACVGGFLGGIVGKLAPEVADAILKALFK